MPNKLTFKAAFDAQLQMTVEPEIAHELVEWTEGTEKSIRKDGPITLLFSSPDVRAMLALGRAIKSMVPDIEVEYYFGDFKVTAELWYKYSGEKGDEQNLP